MDIERLNKSQIILLTLLVSFVTSIATGIVTVSLMDQAPPAIAQTVNRVVEHTVEKIVPTGQAASTVVTQEKTVVIKESDLVASAVEKVSPSMVRLYSRDTETPSFLGMAIVLDAGGTLVADAGSLQDFGDANVSLGDDTYVRAVVVKRDGGLAYLQAATSTKAADGGAKALLWTPVSIATGHAVLGQSVVVLSGKTATRIADGIVTGIIPADLGDVIDTNISSELFMKGSPLISTDGALIGVSTQASRASSPSGFLSAAVLIPPAPAQSSAPKK